MGTVFSFDVRGLGPGTAFGALAEAVRLLHRLDDLLSLWLPDSELSRLERGETVPADCSPDVQEALRLADLAERETGGWFTSAHSHGVDPSGLVKGWAVERAARILVAAGAWGVCLNGGGDIQLHGGPWRVGIAHPTRPGELVAVVTAPAGAEWTAVATSGPAERGCHIVDPTSGAAPAHQWAGVTVVGESLTEADAFATAACAMGAVAPAWLEDRPGVEALLVHDDGRTRQTSGFGARATLA
jgi:thiamine biosynthesis lipoprotein